jgi:hypothetical protein
MPGIAITTQTRSRTAHKERAMPSAIPGTLIEKSYFSLY